MKKNTKKVEVYVGTFCPYCIKAKSLLDKKEVSYITIDVNDEAEREKMVERTNGLRTVPQIFIDDILLEGGCDGLYRREIDGTLNTLLGL